MSFCGERSDYTTGRDPNFEFRQRQGFFFFPKYPDQLFVHPALCLVGTIVLFQGLKWPGRDVETTRLHLVMSLSMRDVPLLPLNALIARKWTNLPLLYCQRPDGSS